jgi:penicillin-binding protein 1A
MSAEIWRRFMTAAHNKLPIRDFDWLLPDATPEIIYQAEEPRPARDHRSRFYDDLSSDFGTDSAEAPPPVDEEPVLDPEPPPVEDAPY